MTISSGVTTGELMAFFLKYDVCFESDVVLPTVTYGGVFTGGCHVRKMLLNTFLRRYLPYTMHTTLNHMSKLCRLM